MHDPTLALKSRALTGPEHLKYVNEARVGQQLIVVHEWGDGHSSICNADAAFVMLTQH